MNHWEQGAVRVTEVEYIRRTMNRFNIVLGDQPGVTYFVDGWGVFNCGRLARGAPRLRRPADIWGLVPPPPRG